MNRIIVNVSAGLATLFLSANAHSSSFDTERAQQVTYKHDFSMWSIPARAGGSTWLDDHGLYTVNILSSNGWGYADLTVNGEPTGTLSPEGATVYKTNNPGIGVAYQLNYSTPGWFSPNYGLIAPNTITLSNNTGLSGYMHIKYQLVRLTEKVPAGKITQVPDVFLNYHNPVEGGHKDLSFLALSGVSAQPIITSCGIDAPTEIKLPTLYGNTLQNGAQNIIQAPTVTLTNCPGAINGISYSFAAVYGTHKASNGVLNTVTGDGYAKNVYVQIQNSDGSAHTINGSIPLSNYNGSGDYILPDFKVAYFIDDANTVTAGKVKTAIELKVTYN
ncbi:fimbrial protein [Salmonella enterica subsp. salamae]|nr:fimbrial protein [Salmonella enterica subsp. salamae]ECF6091664.1 fimbrial protein [Salmonella enterica subsp. salamae]EDW5990876.1 fimbrial protein [Salmonella enterica subsp. salamae]